MNKIKELINKYKELILYVIVGVLTTVVAFVSLYVFHSLLNIRVEIANIISWVFAVVFSFILNKLVVFESKEKNFSKTIKEFGSFVAARLASLGVDELIVVVGCNVLHLNTYLVKAISEVFVVIINYFFSKFVVFKKK